MARVDLLLEEHSDEWSVARMAVVDRTIPRVGIHELCVVPDVPPSVAIGEAVEAATALSSEGAPRFVNGILGRIASELRPAATDRGGRLGGFSERGSSRAGSMTGGVVGSAWGSGRPGWRPRRRRVRLRGPGVSFLPGPS